MPVVVELPIEAMISTASTATYVVDTYRFSQLLSVRQERSKKKSGFNSTWAAPPL
ncbi:MAG: hypothetical protein MUC43_08350 [Pirellula sp.]|nr:hypothetical protein [Pirellula sp.]